MSTYFDDVYGILNPLQKQAVDTIEGPVMVIAGPGTGKTHVLAARIANILKKTDTPPHAILALTFTDSAAANMRERVVKMIGNAGYYVNISTFHSFCVDVIRSYPEFFPLDRDSEPLNEIEKFQLFEELINKLPLKILRPINAPFLYVYELIHHISQLKKEGFTPESFKKVIDEGELIEVKDLSNAEKIKQEKNIAKHKELALVFEAYNSYLRKQRRYDFDDMIALVVEAFSTHEDLLKDYQERLLYFLVDEYQDTNSAQNKVVQLLASYWGSKANLFVVGDPHQSIYRFQGASIENTLAFIETYPEAKIITLDTGYRAPQYIYDAAFGVIAENSLRANNLKADLEEALLSKLTSGKDIDTSVSASSGASTDGKIELIEAPSQTVEAIYIAEEITSLIASGVDPEEIAVLYRNNADAEELQSVFEKWNLLYDVEGGSNILESEPIHQLLTLMSVIHTVKSGVEAEELYRLMLFDWINVEKLTAMKVARLAGKRHTSIVDVILNRTYVKEDQDNGSTLTDIDIHELELLVQNIQAWGILAENKVFTEWFEIVLKESGYIDWVMAQPNRLDLLVSVNSLYREIKQLVSQNFTFSLEDFLHTLRLMQEHRIAIYAEDLNIKKGAIHLSTVHKAKGREWEYVFIAQCIDGKWGNSKKRELISLPKGLLQHTNIDKKEINEDERRLFYVALTRAKKRVTVSYPSTMISARSSKETVASMFVNEIPTDLLIRKSPDTVLDNVESYLERLISPTEKYIGGGMKDAEKNFFKHALRNFKLSVTALNTYLHDPQEFIENVLLRVPRAKAEPMSFGSAVHKSLEDWNGFLLKNGEHPNVELVLKSYREALKKEILLEKDYETRKAYGEEIIKDYYVTRVDMVPDILSAERFFGHGFSKTVFDGMTLVGRIDRIDWKDKGKKLVSVVDYKTGKPRTVGDIEGTTATAAANFSDRERELPVSIRGSYKRQLLFYKLLTELDQTFSPVVVEGVFDFVEPDRQTGKYIARTFELKDEDVKDLRDLIHEVIHEIRELKFLG